jgi:hypothetical protein
MKLDVDSFEFSLPFIIAGGLKIVYDITIGCCFLWNKRKSSIESSRKIESTELVETPSISIQEGKDMDK